MKLKEITMKRHSFAMSIFVIFAMIFIFPTQEFAQGKKVRPSLKAGVTQTLGVDTVVTIEYSRPGVKGRKIWGGLVPYGMEKGNKYSKGKPFPWRAGANENTTFECTGDLLVEGQKLPAGKYSVHMIPSPDEWIIIFNKKNDGWGSYSYDPAMDALRIKVKPVDAPYQEWLVFGFENLAGTSTSVYLHWEKLKIPFNIKLSE